jgi:hypothetical protein
VGVSNLAKQSTGHPALNGSQPPQYGGGGGGGGGGYGGGGLHGGATAQNMGGYPNRGPAEVEGGGRGNKAQLIVGIDFVRPSSHDRRW